MARRPFGGLIQDFAVVDDGGGNVAFGSGGTVLFYNAVTGGSAITDLTSDAAGTTAVTGTTTHDGTGGTAPGAVVTVWGPDELLYMWASYNGSPRVLMFTQDLAAILTDVRTLVNSVGSSLSAHASDANAHGTEWGDLANAALVAPASRSDGYVLGWQASDQTMRLLPPSVAAGAVLLNPPLVGGVYQGNLVTAPSGTSSGNPWLDVRLPYSASDNNPDFMQIHVYHSDGTTRIKSGWKNGNGEERNAPSTPGRIGFRAFESYESIGAVTIGASTGRFAEFSTNPANTALREPLLGIYGTAATGKQGWTESTRVVSAQQGMQIGGNFAGLSAFMFRGRRTSTGAPTTGTWAVGDVVLDSAGAFYLCTAAGTPGTWVTAAAGGGSSAAGAWTGVTAGTSVTLSTGANSAAVRKENSSDSASRMGFRGTLTIGGAISANAVILQLPAGTFPAWDQILIVRDTNAAANRTITVKTTGDVTIGQALSSGNVIQLDGITYALA